MTRTKLSKPRPARREILRPPEMPVMVLLDRRTRVPLHRQIYASIRDAILGGRLAPGTRLPPSRSLAAELGVSRTTVVAAFEQLETEGFISGRRSAGSFVAILRIKPDRPPRREAPLVSSQETTRARRAIELAAAATGVHSIRSAPVPFRIGEPALDLFPTTLWAKLYSRRARRAGASLLGYGDGAGHRGLREAIAAYVSAARAVNATTDQVVLTRGIQQGVSLAARALLGQGDAVWVEDPGYLSPRGVFRTVGARLVPIPVDDEGLMVAVGIERAVAARMVYLSPSHQYPLGATMSLSRRLALLDWARQQRAWVFEDDFDSEFRYVGNPVASLQGLDTQNRVIYAGTFSKTMFPALRLGYLVLPTALVDVVRAVQWTTDAMAGTIEQATVADFIEQGHFSRHVRQMRQAYAARQDALLRGIDRELGELVTVSPTQTGMHVVAWLRDRTPGDEAVSVRARALGVEVAPISRYTADVELPPGLVMGFAATRSADMLPALRALRSAIRNR